MFQWWCVAQNEPWSWQWNAYVGVWIVVALVVLAYRKLLRVSRARAGEGAAGHRKAAWWVGTLLLWMALDYPLGPLGASYLASVHMVQYLLVGLIVPALFLLGVPEGAWDALRERERFSRFLGDATHPFAAVLIFNGGMTVTHWPGVVDALRASQLGSFVLDAAWLACGLAFWWWLLAPVPERSHLHPLLKIAYLGVNAIIITPPAAMLLFSESPVYALYELAPPIGDITPLWDQQLAGGLMKVASAWIMGLGMLAFFLLWYREEKEG